LNDTFQLARNALRARSPSLESVWPDRRPRLFHWRIEVQPIQPGEMLAISEMRQVRGGIENRPAIFALLLFLPSSGRKDDPDWTAER